MRSPRAAAARPLLFLPPQVRVIQAKNLPSDDWWNGLSDPYIVAHLVAPDGARASTVAARRPPACLPHGGLPAWVRRRPC